MTASLLSYKKLHLQTRSHTLKQAPQIFWRDEFLQHLIHTNNSLIIPYNVFWYWPYPQFLPDILLTPFPPPLSVLFEFHFVNLHLYSFNVKNFLIRICYFTYIYFVSVYTLGGKTRISFFLLLLCAFWGLNSGYWMCWQYLCSVYEYCSYLQFCIKYPENAMTC